MLLSPGDDATNDASRLALIQGACQNDKALFPLKNLIFEAKPTPL
jgi:hypothetical protein